MPTSLQDPHSVAPEMSAREGGEREGEGEKERGEERGREEGARALQVPLSREMPLITARQTMARYLTFMDLQLSKTAEERARARCWSRTRDVASKVVTLSLTLFLTPRQSKSRQGNIKAIKAGGRVQELGVHRSRGGVWRIYKSKHGFRGIQLK